MFVMVKMFGTGVPLQQVSLLPGLHTATLRICQLMIHLVYSALTDGNTDMSVAKLFISKDKILYLVTNYFSLGFFQHTLWENVLK
jgi:hypothetical protein